MSGCGGGGGDSASTPITPTVTASAEGVYGGTLTGSSSSAFQMLVLENGDVWALYGTQSSTVFGVTGFIQGTGTSLNGSFDSTNTKDFGFSPARAGTTSAKYDATAKTVSGTIANSGGSVSFSGGPIAGSLYNYNSPASIATVAGAWSMTGLTNERIALNVAASGAFTASTNFGCNFTGTIAARPSGKNIFNVAITFGAAPCALVGQNATGIAVVYPLANGQNQLVVAAVDGTRTYGAAAFGSR